jgi:hypothetical protein
MKQDDIAQWLMANDFTVEHHRLHVTVDGPPSGTGMVIIRAVAADVNRGPWAMSDHAAAAVFRAYVDMLSTAVSSDDDAAAR